MDEIEAYIQQHPPDVQVHLRRLRAIVKAHAPEAAEQIAYGMPAYKTHKKPLIYFAAYKNHIGLYATPSGHSEFKEELSIYKQGKGSVQFPLNQAMPYELIERIVKFKVAENSTKRK